MLFRRGAGGLEVEGRALVGGAAHHRLKTAGGFIRTVLRALPVLRSLGKGLYLKILNL